MFIPEAIETEKKEFLRFSKLERNACGTMSYITDYQKNHIKLQTPPMKCVNGIEEDNGKYWIVLEFDKSEECRQFYHVLYNFECRHEEEAQNRPDWPKANYRSQFTTNNTIKIKLPFRFKRFQTEIVNGPISVDSIVQVEIETKGIWFFKDYYGCTWVAKKVIIL